LFTEAINFAQNAKPYFSKVIMTFVSYVNIVLGRTIKFVEDIGAEFRLREYF